MYKKKYANYISLYSKCKYKFPFNFTRLLSSAQINQMFICVSLVLFASWSSEGVITAQGIPNPVFLSPTLTPVDGSHSSLKY